MGIACLQWLSEELEWKSLVLIISSLR